MQPCRQHASPLLPHLTVRAAACFTSLLLITNISALLASPLQTPPAPTTQTPPPAITLSPAITPAPAITLSPAITSLRTIRASIDAANTAPFPASSFPPARGACIIIRAPRDLTGEILAITSVLAPSPSEPPSSQLTADAVNRALTLARARLSTLLPPSTTASPTAPSDAKLAELLRLCTISLELVESINTIPLDRLETLDQTFAPLTHGFAVTIPSDNKQGDVKTAAVFASESMLAGLSNSAAAGRALAEATGRPEAPLKPLTSNTGPAPTFFTLTTSHAAEASAGVVVPLLTCDQPVPLSQVDSLTKLISLTSSLATSLQRLVDANPAAPLPEEINLATGRITPSDDPHRAAATDALTLLSLERAARTLARFPDAQPQAANLTPAIKTLASRLSTYFTQPNLPPLQPASPAPLITAASLPLLTTSITPEARAAATTRLKPLLDQFTPGSLKTRTPQPTDGLLLSALLRAELIQPQEAVTALLTPGPQHLLRAAPWSTWLLLRHLSNPASCSADNTDALFQQLAASREAILRLQARTTSDTPDPSHRGGLLLPLRQASLLDTLPDPATIADAQRLPTWRTFTLTAALPSYIFDPMLIPTAKQPEALVSMTLAMRYLRQLQVDPQTSWFAQDPTQYQGMVRLATWEVRTTPNATSLALLAACDTLAALTHLTTKSQPPQPPIPATTPAPAPATTPNPKTP